MTDTAIQPIEVWRLHARMAVERCVGAEVESVPIYGNWRPAGLTLGSPVERTEIPITNRYLRILTAGGCEGLSLGWPSFADLHLDSIAPAHLLGRDALDIAHIWHSIHRMPRHQARGDYNSTLSLIDIALWDLRGKHFGVPTATLLGGTRRQSIPAYGMTLHLPGAMGDDLAAIRTWASRLKDQGYRYQKWCLQAGSADHLSTLHRRVRKVRAIREALGDEADFILACHPLGKAAKALFQSVEPFYPMHIQVAVEMGLREFYAELRQLSTVPVGAGQGIQNRWELAEYLDPRCVDCLGYDPEKGGGLTELSRMSYMAEASGLTVYPHAGLPTNLHLAASLPEDLCPMVEYLITWNPHKLFFEDYDYVPKAGTIDLPAYPGIFRWAEDRIEKRELVREWTL
jgi:D-galactarolactone cycloisomerase